jgi:CheY-like chemotaxis protein
MMEQRILVVDDNAVNRKLIAVALKVAGYDVLAAADGEAALALVTTLHPSLIMMDIQLPGMDGLEVTRRLKADPATRSIAIVAITAYAMVGDEQKARDAGCDGYIAKPIDTRRLPEVVASYLNGGQP